MEYHNGWTSYLMQTKGCICPPLEGEKNTDVVVIGWWMAGLFAAKKLAECGKKVILVERNICWWWMSWRSGGFLTPDSELWLRQIERKYGKETAKQLREFWQSWQDNIVQLARNEWFRCDLQDEDSLLLWWKKWWQKEVIDEYEARQEYWYEGKYVAKEELYKHTSWRHYTAWLRYKNCFAINPMVFCQEMKHYLQKLWVQVYEQTTIQSYTHNYIKTSRWSIRCNHMIFTVGKVQKELHKEYAKDTYWLQNFITMSEPLSDEIVNLMFPKWKLMCRDTKMAFTYFRFTWDNRLILWWGNMLTAGLPFDILYPYGIQSVIKEIKSNYNTMQPFSFDFYRNGRIEATKDMMPIIDHDTQYDNHRWVQWCVWLPWASASWVLAASLLLGDKSDLASHFTRARKNRIPRRVNSPLLKSVLYGLNNLYVMK
jgi:glycine/D-amino acid oxidase-like deaminating enzyme